MHSTGYIFRFAAIVTVVCSLLLAIASTALKPLQDTQRELFVKKNILKVLDLEAKEGASAEEVLNSYRENVTQLFTDLDGNEVAAPKNADEFDQLKEFKRFALAYNSENDAALIKKSAEYKKDPMKLLFFVRKNANGEVMSYALPVFGKGLWSTIKGYIALKTDMNTVQAITFYEHAETPGLGARIEEDWFTSSFKNKKIFDENGELVSIDIVKGGINTEDPFQVAHGVDGVSGATITSHGVQNFIKTDLVLYTPFLKNKMKQSDAEMSTDSNKE